MIPWVPAVQIGQQLPGDTPFVDERGRPFTWNGLRGKTVVLSFIYTRCPEPNECPAISLKFAELQRELPRDAQLLEVTLDPERDTPAALAAYGENFGEDPARWTLATGVPDEVRTFARRFNVFVKPDPRYPGMLIHTEAVAVVDADGRLASLTAGNAWQPREIVAEVAAARGEGGNPWDRTTLWFRNAGIACGAVLGGNDAWARTLQIALGIAALAGSLLAGGYLVRSLLRT
jgi:protein SCO1/2